MPKVEIDYSNIIIYKITCNDPNITDAYVGHTTNFVQRKHCHKQECINKNSSNYKCKLYETIRCNGGWANWSMEIINFFNCADHYEARKKEQEYFVLLNANLNSIEPFPKPKIKSNPILDKKEKQPIYCQSCNVYLQNIQLLDIHNNTQKHIKKCEPNNIIFKKNANDFVCEICDFKCCKQSEYDRHLSTTKHQNNIKEIQKTPKNADSPNCNCGKEYTNYSSLLRHKKTCKDDKDNTLKNIVLEVIKQNNDNNCNNNSNTNSNNELIQYLINDNKEFKNLILEIVKKETIGNVNNNTINNNNCNNKSFNLNVFLNEKCKDAMNMSEFVDTIKMQLSDLENFAHLGYADGVSKIFVQGINALDIHLRPIHCSDSKRETLYIKDNDEWVKETDDKPLIINAIKKVAFKNIKQINEWVKENPECKDPRTKKYDKYNKIVMNAMSGGTAEEQKDNIEKIVKNVTKAVTIDKYSLK